MQTGASRVIADHVVGLACTGCGRQTQDPWEWSCDACGPGVRREVVYAPDAIVRMRARGG